MPLIHSTEQILQSIQHGFRSNCIYLYPSSISPIGDFSEFRQLRESPNAFAVPLRWTYYSGDNAFFTDADEPLAMKRILFPFIIASSWLRENRTVVIPTDGFPFAAERAPKIAASLSILVDSLKNTAERMENIK